jgi:isopentenyl diphosphate isomerase/L-lactate dehydrogenase-like FMN-dependent dehydrogenase
MAMTPSERSWEKGIGRRRAVRAMAGLLTGSPLVRGQLDPFRDHSRVPRLDEMRDAFDFEAVAFEKLPRAAFDYTAHGSESEFTLRRNREAFDWVKLVPRAISAGGDPDASIELFGAKMAYPIFISPTAAQAQLHPEGELAMHQGATAANTTMIVSNVSSFPFEKIAEAAAGPLWFQLYPREEMDANRAMLDTVQSAGAKAVVVTIDQQASYYERTLHGRHLNPPPRRSAAPRQARGTYGLIQGRLWYDWKFFGQLRTIVKVPLIAKGILTAEDARLCLENGLDAVYVSNHGGRSLDYGPSTLEVLPEIVEAVSGKVPILFDSGVRRGADILKALALGATAICLGRTPRWGLGAYGVPGVQRLLEMTQAELRQAMIHTGRLTQASIDRTLVRTDFP